MLDTPVLFLVFNRPDTTAQVLAKIREARPKQLFVAADGPRRDKVGEQEKCEQVRESILQGVDWNCEVKTLFREENLGCGRAVSEAITWFFNNVESGIILEDDTVPSLGFFEFCESLLRHHQTDESIMHISGSNFQFGRKNGEASYYYSRYNHIWGWATWRRAWESYVFNVKNQPLQQLKNSIDTIFCTEGEKEYWKNVLKQMINQEIDTWDYQWHFTMWLHEGFAVIPNTNLISNIGISPDSTHTYQTEMKTATLAAGNIAYIKHPKEIRIYPAAEERDFINRYNTPSTLANKVRNIAYQMLPEQMLSYWRKIKLKTSKMDVKN